MTGGYGILPILPIWRIGLPVSLESLPNLVSSRLGRVYPQGKKEEAKKLRSGAEGGTRSRMSRSPAHAPTKGPSPLVPSLRFGHPMKGVFPLQNPQFESRLYSFC